MLDGIRSEWWAPSDQNTWTASLGIRTAISDRLARFLSRHGGQRFCVECLARAIPGSETLSKPARCRRVGRPLGLPHRGRWRLQPLWPHQTNDQSTLGRPLMTRIVTTTYRYKPPPKRKGRKLAEITGPAVVTAKGSRRLVGVGETAAEVESKFCPPGRRAGDTKPSTPLRKSAQHPPTMIASRRSPVASSDR